MFRFLFLVLGIMLKNRSLPNIMQMPNPNCNIAVLTPVLGELRKDLSMDKADIALNSYTMPMGAVLSRAGGSKAALMLGDWIRKNLCEPLPREGQGRRN